LKRSALLLQALSATATIARKAPVRLKRYRMQASFEIPMAGPHTFSAGRIGSNAQEGRNSCGAIKSRRNRPRILSSRPAAIQQCSSTSIVGRIGFPCTEHGFTEMSRPWRCETIQSLGPRTAMFRTMYLVTRHSPSGLWRSSWLPRLQCCFIDESGRGAQSRSALPVTASLPDHFLSARDGSRPTGEDSWSRQLGLVVGYFRHRHPPSDAHVTASHNRSAW
jgi:hypothetical protein